MMPTNLFVFLFCVTFLPFDLVTGRIEADPVGKPLLRGVTRRDWSLKIYKENDTFSGYFVDLMDKISEKVGFDYQLYYPPVVPGKFGERDANGTWDGMIGEVNQMKTDFAVYDIEITEEYKEAVDFTIPHDDSSLVILIARENAQNMTTFEDLVNYNERVVSPSEQVSIGMLANGTIYSTLSATNDTIGQKLFSYASQNESNFIQGTFMKDGVNRVENSKFAFVTSSYRAKFHLERNCSLTALRDNRGLFKLEYGFALQKGSKWLEPFNRAIQELKSDGTIEEGKKHYWPEPCTTGNSAANATKTINFTLFVLF